MKRNRSSCTYRSQKQMQPEKNILNSPSSIMLNKYKRFYFFRAFSCIHALSNSRSYTWKMSLSETSKGASISKISSGVCHRHFSVWGGGWRANLEFSGTARGSSFCPRLRCPVACVCVHASMRACVCVCVWEGGRLLCWPGINISPSLTKINTVTDSATQRNLSGKSAGLSPVTSGLAPFHRGKI